MDQNKGNPRINLKSQKKVGEWVSELQIMFIAKIKCFTFVTKIANKCKKT